MKTVAFTINTWGIVFAFLSILATPATAQKQAITPANDGTGTLVIPQGNRFDITGGTTSRERANLFHSFQKFNLSEGQIANFLSNPNIRNILGRVTGGEASYINGLIQVSGGNSNLFLINPAGIIFGAGASLNVPSSFTATTATRIGFNGGWFNAFGANDYTALVGNPNVFSFDLSKLGWIINTANLSLQPKNNLTLLGGMVLNLGTLSAPGGNITIAAVRESSLVRISQTGHILSLEIKREASDRASLPELLTGGSVAHASGVQVNTDGTINLTTTEMNMPYKPGVAIASGTLEATGRNINILGATRKANAINPKAATVTMAPEITLNTDRGNILINSMKNNPDGIFSPPPLQPPPPPPPTGARIGQQFVQLQKQPPQQVTVVNNTGNVGNVPNVQIAIAELEQRRHQEFSNYFGANLSKYFTNTTNVREALVEIYHQTKNRSAIVYVTALPDELELILYAAKTHPIRKTIPQAKRDKLMKVVAEFHYSLTAPHYRTTTNYLQPAQQLYQWLITPIEEELRANSIDTILFSMDAGLRSLPVAALHDGQQFLVEKYSLALIPSISLVDSRYKSLEDAKILAMGASNFSIFAPSLSPLPAVPVELSAITQQREGIILLNEEFTLNNLKSQRSKYPFEIIHLATHGEFKPGDMSKSYIQLWKEKLQLDQMRSLGFNNPPVELLVLSACQTAVGDERAELGFAGFAVAAGVKTALASLWYVSDEGTLALMSEFYSQLKNAKIKAEALRQAQVAMSRGEVKVEGGYLRSVGIKDRVPLPPELANKLMINLSHPYYWSAFTMIGSPW